MRRDSAKKCIKNITTVFQVILTPLIYISLDISHCALVIHNDVHLHTAGEKLMNSITSLICETLCLRCSSLILLCLLITTE